MNIIILGMHRSGTSAVASLVNHFGFYFGEDRYMQEPDNWNPLGYFERKDIGFLNDRILAEHDSTWYQVNTPKLDQINSKGIRELSDEIVSIIGNLDASQPWAIKDPRLSLLLPAWKQFVGDCVYVMPYRHPVEVAMSINKRDNFPIDYGVALWEAYVSACINHTLHDNLILLPYEKLVGNPQEVTKNFYDQLLACGCQDIVMPECGEIDNIIKPDLYRQKTNEYDSKNRYVEQITFYKELQECTFKRDGVRNVSTWALNTIKDDIAVGQEFSSLTSSNIRNLKALNKLDSKYQLLKCKSTKTKHLRATKNYNILLSQIRKQIEDNKIADVRKKNELDQYKLWLSKIVQDAQLTLDSRRMKLIRCLPAFSKDDSTGLLWNPPVRRTLQRYREWQEEFGSLSKNYDQHESSESKVKPVDFEIKFQQLSKAYRELELQYRNVSGGRKITLRKLKKYITRKLAVSALRGKGNFTVSKHWIGRKQLNDLVPDDPESSRVIEIANRAIDDLRPSTPQEVKTIAFYLPQFHPIPENDQWWGKGFTEWTNVTKARKLFDDHFQPHLPSDLGFYDLRVPEIREQQAKLASSYGIYGFCYHHYWFGGKKLLERPLQEVLKIGHPDFPFCICWANEHWTRTWDGKPNDILMAQDHGLEDYNGFILDLLPVLRDSRYIRVDGKALILVYQPRLIPNTRDVTDKWRELCLENGVGELYLCAALTFSMGDPTPLGFDAAVEFPPHQCGYSYLNSFVPSGLLKHFTGKLFDYRKVVEHSVNALISETYAYRRIHSVMPSWDNSARVGTNANIWMNSSPELYEAWLSATVTKASAASDEKDRLVFINAWNEWAEGCHLEPDSQYGHQFLKATRTAIESPHIKSDAYQSSKGISSSDSNLNSHPIWVRASTMENREWYRCLARSVDSNDVDGLVMPKFPDSVLQTSIMGSSGVTAINEIIPFYESICDSLNVYSKTLNENSKVLDFGTGWGRILRFFLKNVSPSNLYGIDVMEKMIDICKETFPGPTFQLTDPLPPTKLRDDYFDLMVAYSVFSHLSEDASNAWIKEASRILKPGGLLCFTTQKESFIDYCESFRQSGNLTHDWHHNLVKSWVDVDSAHKQFREGKFLHESTGGGDLLSNNYYGESIISPAYAKNNWSGEFEVLGYDAGDKIPQAYFTLRNRK